MLDLVAGDGGPVGKSTKRLKVVDYYTTPWEDTPAGTPSAVMVYVLDFATNKEEVFSWHLFAELEGIRPEQILARRDDLERRVLQAFFSYMTANPKARWLHWGLDRASYGFPALAHRHHVLVGTIPERFEGRQINLADLLKEKFGDDYAPHQRLTSLIRSYNLNDHQLLDLKGLTAAFRDGDYSGMLWSLRRKVACIAGITRNLLLGRWPPGAGGEVTNPLQGPGPIPGGQWVGCVRGAAGDGARQAQGLPGRHANSPETSLVEVRASETSPGAGQQAAAENPPLPVDGAKIPLSQAKHPDGTIEDNRIWLRGESYKLTGGLRTLLSYLLANQGVSEKDVERHCGFGNSSHLHKRLRDLRKCLARELKNSSERLSIKTEETRIFFAWQQR